MSFLHPVRDSVACMFDDRTLRFFHVSKKGTDITVKQFFSERIADQFITQDERIMVDPIIIQRLRGLRKKHRFTNIHLVIPDRYITVFHTVMPHTVIKTGTTTNQNSLQKIIELYLQKVIQSHPQFTASDIISDYEVIQESDEGYHIHVSVAHPDQFRFFPEILESAGFTIGHIDITSFAIHRVAQYMNQGALYGTIAIAGRDTQISVIRSGKIIASSWCQIGSEQLLQTLQEKLSIPLREAQKIITHYGVLQTHPDPLILHALRDTLQPLVTGLHQAIESCSSKVYNHPFYHGAPNQWYLYGIGASIPGIAQYLGIRSGSMVTPIDVIPTELMDDEIIIQIPAEELPLYLPVMSTALAYLLE